MQRHADSSASALVAVADSTAAEAAPVQPVMPATTAGDHESSSPQDPDEHQRHISPKTPAPVVQAVALESSGAESSVSTDTAIETVSSSDDLWIAPPGQVSLGRFFPKSLAGSARRS